MRWKHRRAIFNPGKKLKKKRKFFIFFLVIIFLNILRIPSTVIYLSNKRIQFKSVHFFNTFFKRILMTFIDHFNQITSVLTEKLRNMADGKTVVSLFSEINRATLDAIALVNF